MRIDVNTRRPILKMNTGGLSGPAVLPVAVRMVWEVSQAVKVPVLGMGGVSKGEDAAQLMLAGASAVAVGTALLPTPSPRSRCGTVWRPSPPDRAWRLSPGSPEACAPGKPAGAVPHFYQEELPCWKN